MKCPFCSHSDTQVMETRVAEDGDFIRRRRQCASCEKRFTTYERPDVTFPAIVKKDGRRIEYERANVNRYFASSADSTSTELLFPPLLKPT